MGTRRRDGASATSSSCCRCSCRLHCSACCSSTAAISGICVQKPRIRSSIGLVVSVDTATGRAPGAITALNQEALSRLAAIPGVQSAALSGMTPISGAAGSRFMTVEGFQEPASARRRVSINSVSANYFATLGTPLVAGRDFRASDVGPARVAIANLAMVRHYFAGTMPLGVHVQLEGDDHAPLEIIGVAADAE